MFAIFFSFLSIALAQVSYSDVESLIQTQNIKTIEQLLKALPPNYKNNYTLLKKSSALQEASLKNPRAIVYGETGELTLTFNSSPEHGGYNDVEFLAFDKVTKEFELRVITFQNDKTVFSEKNPTQCTHCHGLNPRPLWDNYPVWTNAFASKSDILSPKEEEVLMSEYFREHPRFKAIIKKDADPLYPYNDAPATFGPNAMLGKLYTSMQAQANVKRVLESKGYQYSEELALLAIANCPVTIEQKRKLEDFYLVKIKMLYPNQTATLEWWIGKYTGEPFFLTLLQSIYLFGIEYFQNNYFNLKMRYHEEHLSSDSSHSVRDASRDAIGPFVKNTQLKHLILTYNKPELCKQLISIAHSYF